MNDTTEKLKNIVPIKLRPCPGSIIRSHPKSIITNVRSTGFCRYLSETYSKDSLGREIVIIQAMPFNDGLLVEYMFKEDYDNATILR